MCHRNCTLATGGREVKTTKNGSGGGYVQQRSYYGTSVRWTFGSATIFLDSNRNPVGFHDDYDFDAHGRESYSAQAMTVVGALGYTAGGDNFSIDYNNGLCGL
jgi:hypothetical protein